MTFRRPPHSWKKNQIYRVNFCLSEYFAYEESIFSVDLSTSSFTADKISNRLQLLSLKVDNLAEMFIGIMEHAASVGKIDAIEKICNENRALLLKQNAQAPVRILEDNQTPELSTKVDNL